MTAREFITQAMKDLKILAAGEDPTADEMQDGLDCLNQLVDGIGLERLMLYKTVRTVKTLASLTVSYTIGAGASIDIPRPAWIDRASLALDLNADPVVEVPIKVLNEEEYAEWPSKTQTASRVSAIYYDHDYSSGFGRIHPLPVPDVGTTALLLYTPGGHIEEFDDADAEFTAPRGYRRWLRANLAIEMEPMFEGSVVSPWLAKRAADSRSAIQSTNVRTRARRSDPTLVGGRGGFNIDSSTFR